MMKTVAVLILTLVASATAWAEARLVSNPNLPYPPACALTANPNLPGGLDGIGVVFFEDELEFYGSGAGEEVPMLVRLIRTPCDEPNRSLIWLELVLDERYSFEDYQIQLPSAVAEISPNFRMLMTLAAGPNGWGAGGWVDREARYLESQLQGFRSENVTPRGERRWVFLLDNAPWSPYEFFDSVLSPSEYNAAFKLILRYNPHDFFTIDVPATLDLFPAHEPDMPFSSRLSGNWVIPGTSDQGIMLSVSELVSPGLLFDVVPPDMPMVVFFAHYTFDEQGQMLWLTGAAEFLPGNRQLTIPIELVTHGEFRGSKRASREVIGSVKLRSRSCNHIEFDYDYSGIGQGTGRHRLERLFSMETAGHDCRDYEARMAANR